MGIIVILHNVSSSVYEFLDYKLVHTTTLIINLLICLSYPLNFGIYCGMSRQFRETFKDLFMKVRNINPISELNCCCWLITSN